MNLYEIMLEMNRLDADIQELNEKLKKEDDPTMRKVYMDEIDRKLAKILEIKHKMEVIKL